MNAIDYSRDEGVLNPLARDKSKNFANGPSVFGLRVSAFLFDPRFSFH
jgi:hypothetical protein